MKRVVKTSVLQLKNRTPYMRNLDRIFRYLDRLKDRDLIVAPEVCLTDYNYENLEEAVKFGEYATKELIQRVGNQILVFTRLIKRDDGYYNEAVVFNNNKIVHKQAKHKLFLLGEEDKYLKSGSIEEIVPFEIDGVKYGILICFELRYKELWQRLEGCDIILLPSQWGLPRKRHLEILSSALGVMNQCFVVVANSSKEDMASSSGIYSPNGGVTREDMTELIEFDIELSLVRKIRRYIKMR